MTEVVKESPKAEVKERDIQINPARCKLREYANNDHVVTVEPGTTIEDVLRPQFWAHYAQNFRPYDEVTVRTDDGIWYAKLLILSSGRTWAKAKLLSNVNLTTADVDLTDNAEFDGYEIKWRGPHCKFSVIQKSDHSVLQEGFDKKTEAITFLAEHVKKG